MSILKWKKKKKKEHISNKVGLSEKYTSSM